MSSVSVLIVTYRRPEGLKRCLADLANQTRLPEEVIVIDNAGHDPESAAICDESSLRVRYTPATRNSLPAARNQAFQQSTGDYLVLIDDDVRISDNYLATMVTVFEERPEAVGIQGYIPQSPRRWYEEAIRRMFAMYHLEDNKCRVLRSITTTYPSSLTSISPCEWISGSNQAYRRSALERVRWDETLLKYADGEDLDHSYRVYRHYGGGLFITPDAHVIHDESPMGRSIGYQLILMREVYGWYLLHKLFPGSLAARAVYIWNRIGRLALALAAMILSRRPTAKRETSDLLAAYAYVGRRRRQIAAGDLTEFNDALERGQLER